MSLDCYGLPRAVWPSHLPPPKPLANSQGRSTRLAGDAVCSSISLQLRHSRTNGEALATGLATYEQPDRSCPLIPSYKAGEGSAFAQDDLLFDFLEDDGIDMEPVHELQDRSLAQAKEYPSRSSMIQISLLEGLETGFGHSKPIEIPSPRKIESAKSAEQSILDGLGSEYPEGQEHLDSSIQESLIPEKCGFHEQDTYRIVAPHILLARMSNSSSKIQSSCRPKGLAHLRQRNALLTMTGYFDGYTEMGQRPQNFPRQTC